MISFCLIIDDGIVRRCDVRKILRDDVDVAVTHFDSRKKSIKPTHFLDSRTFYVQNQNQIGRLFFSFVEEVNGAGNGRAGGLGEEEKRRSLLRRRKSMAAKKKAKKKVAKKKTAKKKSKK